MFEISPFNLLIFKTNRGEELGINFTKSSNEKELNNSTYYSYFFILFKAKTKYAIKRNRRHPKRFLTLRKKVKRIEKIAKDFIPKS